MTWRDWPTWIAMLTLATGCAAQWDVDRFEAPEADVAARRVFFWKGGEVGTPAALEPAVLRTVDAEIRAVVIDELTRKGYERTDDAASAQMLVSYQIAGSRRFIGSDDERVGAPSPTTVLSPSEMQPPPASTVPREIAVRDGSVMVFADDPATGKLIWRGMVSAETRVGSSEQGARMITEMAREIVQGFPARSPAR